MNPINQLNSLISKCKKSDLACIESSINEALPKIFDGIPELGVESSDPNFIKVIEEDISIIKYKFTNSSITGYKNCNITKLKFNDDMTTLSCDVNCPPLLMNGQYEVKGQLLDLQIEGNGDFEFTSGYYLIHLSATLEIIEGSDGKNHLVVEDLKLRPNPLTEIKYKFQNLFNGKKELAEVMHEYAKKHWLEIALLLQHPIWSTSFNEVLGHVNKYLQHVAIEDILVD
ncbi:uncharacterized protein LOC126772579 [Nymphalis io]|uniref:uncharacterized protein LOC126772579 n=1 Tax=Inachis io TaxID=171585 RepID=UPI0021679F85|nr:uncharacterized protein LOC126772579 [Nymphalis io]